jgi:beta-lactamase class C
MPVDDVDAPFNQPYSKYTTVELNNFMYSYKPNSSLAGTFQYSNLGYALLGWGIGLAEDGHNDFGMLTTKVITEPLQMVDTAVNLTPEKAARMLPTFLAPSNNSSQPTQVPPMKWDKSSILAASDGLKSTLADMVKFVEANMAATGPPDSAASKKVNIAAMPELNIAMKMAQKWRTGYNTGERRGVGLGWGIEQWSTKSGNSSLLWHSGSTYGSSAFAAFNSQLEIGIVVLANQGRGKQWSPEEIGFAVVDRWFNQALTGALQKANGSVMLLGSCRLGLLIFGASMLSMLLVA